MLYTFMCCGAQQEFILSMKLYMYVIHCSSIIFSLPTKNQILQSVIVLLNSVTWCGQCADSRMKVLVALENRSL